MRAIATFATLLVFTTSLIAQQPRSLAVRLRAEVKEKPSPTITLKWVKDPNQKLVGIWRKARDAPRWPTSISAQLDSTASEWTDTRVEDGVAYEYRVLADITEPAGKDTTTGEQLYRRFWAFGYIYSGMNVPPTPPGRVLVLVDSTVHQALKLHLDTLRADLEAESWEVDIRTVSRTETFSGAAVQNIRSIIKASAAGPGAPLQSVFLVGRVAVPYSGDIAPDGHVPDHRGAWPADGIYGDLDGNYSDANVNFANTSRPVNANLPGDGKFDQSVFAQTVSVAVGRVDFFDMPQFSSSEVDLLKAYFVKDHAFRTAQFPVLTGGIIDDNFGSYGEWFSASPWRSFSVFGSDTSVKADDWFGSLAGPTTYLWSYGCGGGTNTSAGGVGKTEDFATKPVYAIHTQLFGSYFGDWNTRNNLLRASLASSPRALTCAWNARPAWYMHHMALGETIGQTSLVAMNNQSIVGGQLGTYTPNVYYVGANSALASIGDRGVHMALLGDPTLRAFMGSLPRITTATHATEYPNIVNLEFASTTADAYMVYRLSTTGEPELMTPQPIKDGSFKDSLVHEGTLTYRVHGCVLRRTASGTYYDMGPGERVMVATTSVADVLNEKRPSLTIAPNPATDHVELHVAIGQSCFVKIDILDLTGQLVLHLERMVSAGTHRFSMQTSELVAGRYLVTVSTPTAVTTESLTIIR